MAHCGLLHQIKKNWTVSRPPLPRGLRRSLRLSPAVIVGSNPAGGDGCLPVVSVVCCQVEVLRRDDHPSGGVLQTVVRR